MSRSRTNQEWMDALAATGEDQALALTDLHHLLLHAVLLTFSKYLPDSIDPQWARAQAEDCAQDSLVSVLAHLSEFRGESKFTTWAYKFGVNNAITSVYRSRWHGISLDELNEIHKPHELILEDDSPAFSTEQIQAQKETWSIVLDVIQTELTIRQRQVLEWLVFEEVPMDVVTERLETKRNAVYKLLYDARRKVKRRLEAIGYTYDEILKIFEHR